MLEENKLRRGQAANSGTTTSDPERALADLITCTFESNW